MCIISNDWRNETMANINSNVNESQWPVVIMKIIINVCVK